jgi:hypothetical protein
MAVLCSSGLSGLAQSPLEHSAVGFGAESRAEAGSAASQERRAAPAWGFRRQAEVPRNAVYVEFGGASGDRMSINYERAVWREARFAFLARTGLFYFQPGPSDSRNPTSLLQNNSDGPRHAGDLILGLHTVYGGPGRHRVETGINWNLRWTRENGITRYGTQNLASAQVGYRLLPRGGKGFLFRAQAMLVHAPPYNWVHFALEGEKIPAKVLPWAGISIGYAF